MARNRIEKIYELIGLKIRNKRNDIGFSQEDLAKQSNLERPSVVLIESGKQKLPIDRLYLIAHALECSPKDLLPESNEVFEGAYAGEVTDEVPIISHKGHELDSNGEKKIRDFLRKATQKRGVYEARSNSKKSPNTVKRTRH